MEGSCLTGLSSALARQESFIKPSLKDVRTWREARGGADMHKAVPVTLIERQYSGHPDATPFMSPSMPPIVDFQRSDKDKDGSMRKEQETLGLAAMSLTAGLSHLETGTAQVKEALDKIPEGRSKDN